MKVRPIHDLVTYVYIQKQKNGVIEKKTWVKLSVFF